MLIAIPRTQMNFYINRSLYIYCNLNKKDNLKKKTIFISLLQFQENSIIFIYKPISVRLLQLKQNRPFFYKPIFLYTYCNLNKTDYFYYKPIFISLLQFKQYLDFIRHHFNMKHTVINGVSIKEEI